MAEVLRACVIAKSRWSRRPFGWGCSRKRRKIAEATHAAQKMHAWYPSSVLAGGGPNRSERRPLCISTTNYPVPFCGPPATDNGYRLGSDSAIDKASCAPACNARQHNTNQAATPFDVPPAKPRAASR